MRRYSPLPNQYFGDAGLFGRQELSCPTRQGGALTAVLGYFFVHFSLFSFDLAVGRRVFPEEALKMSTQSELPS